MQSGFPKALPETVATFAFSSKYREKSDAFFIAFPCNVFPKK